MVRGGAPGSCDEEITTPSEQASEGAGDRSDAQDPGQERGKADRRAGYRTGRPLQRHRRYGLLLIILLGTYLLSAFIKSTWIKDAQLILFTAAGLLAIRYSPIRRRSIRMVVGALLIVALVMVDVSVHEGGTAGKAAASIWAGALLLAIVVLLLHQILSQQEVTVQSIYGAISAYLIIGLMFASFYSAMYFLHSETFFAGHQRGTTSSFQYFSFTTLTTLGYGDFTAGSSEGRAVAMLEAMTGQIFLATLVAKLVASFRPARASAREAADPSARHDR